MSSISVHANGRESTRESAVGNAFERVREWFGAANRLIYVRGRGMVNELPLIATSLEAGWLEAIGRMAGEMPGRTPKNITVAQPIRGWRER